VFVFWVGFLVWGLVLLLVAVKKDIKRQKKIQKDTERYKKIEKDRERCRLHAADGVV